MNRKNLLFTSLVWFSLAIAMALSACISSRDYVVDSDYSYSGNFGDYKTYTFFNYYKFDEDSLVPDQLIKDAIHYRMSLLGYREDDKKPNILIGYKIFFHDFKFKGYDQPDLEQWLKDSIDIKQVYNPVKYKLMQGTLFIFIVDREKDKAIWQGYNSGLINPANINNEKFVKGSVRTIFDKYRVFAEGYINNASM